MCENGFEIIAGPDKGNMNKTRLPVYMAHYPAGTSVKNMLHYAQMVRSGKNLFFKCFVIPGYSKLIRPLERKKGKSWGLIDE